MSERTERGLTPFAQWSPFSDLDLFDVFGRSMRPGRTLQDVVGGRGAPAGFAPAVDVAENDDEYVISAEVPGAKQEDITVELHDGVLTLRGEKKREHQEEKDHVRYVERSYGSFSRSFSLPANADGDKLTASFSDGVLRLRVPKREEAKPRVINIRS